MCLARTVACDNASRFWHWSASRDRSAPTTALISPLLTRELPSPFVVGLLVVVRDAQQLLVQLMTPTRFTPRTAAVRTAVAEDPRAWFPPVLPIRILLVKSHRDPHKRRSRGWEW